MKTKLKDNWYWIIIGGFILFAIAVFAILGEDSVIAVHDNLDLFIPQYEMMRTAGNFWGHSTIVGFLAGQSRDYLPSEFNLVTIIYMILPAYAAYVTCYILKIIITIVGAYLFAKDVLKENYVNYKPLIFLVGFAYGILNLFPNFGIPFASIPLLLFIMHKIVIKPHFGWFLALFAYPFISYFSYLGIFFIGYICVYFVYKWIKDKKFPARVLISIIVLSAGYIACEYRLFATMLFSDVESIRETMVRQPISGSEIFKEMLNGFTKGDMHTESVHTYFVMPVCLIFFVIQTAIYIKNKEIKKIFTDYFNGVMLFIVFNSVMFGAFNYEPFRHLFEVILPPLKGFEFARTEFSNPFLWYLAFFIVLKRMYDLLPKFKWVANVMAVIAVFVIVLSGTRFNDLYNTAYDQYCQFRNGKPSNSLSFGEFYSTELFEKAKEDINYTGQWSVAYGFYPAVLEYNGINTLDGYLGYYEESYKECFREIIAPALERIPESKAYYDNWGARCYMYSGTNVSIVNAYRDYSYTDEDIYIDLDAFKYNGGRYIFSRLKLNNAEEVGLELVNIYTDENSPYTLYLYKTKSRYMSKEHSGIPYEDRELTYDIALMDSIIAEFREVIDSANEADSTDYTDEEIQYYLGRLDEYETELDKLSEVYCIYDIASNMDVTVDTYDETKEQVYSNYMDYYDLYGALIRDMILSPAKSILQVRYPEYILAARAEYEDMTKEEKDRVLKIQSLQDEYLTTVAEDFYYEYDGVEWNMDTLLEHAEELDYDVLIEIYNGIMKEKGLCVGEIYKELVQLNTEIAKEKDYDDYAEYAYINGFARDYTPSDVKSLCKEIRKNRKYIQKAERSVNGIADNDPGWITQDDTETFEYIQPYLEKVSPELNEAMEYMLENNLYNLEVSSTKPDMGYTMSLDYSGDAYIFDSPYQSVNDFYTYVHEYGHYNRMFHEHEGIFRSQHNLDMSEIHSQGLELLFSNNYVDMFGEEQGLFMQTNEVFNILNTVCETAMVAEFEIYAYENPDASIEELGKKYSKLLKQYGYGDGEGESYEWVNITHLFEQPLYYISYATSALAALDIYTVSFTDYDYACEKYMEITALPSGSGYRNLLQCTFLPDIFEKGNTSMIIQTISKKIQEQANEIHNG